MINSLNMTVGGADAATSRSQLVEQLARRVDVNRDGQVTSQEFTSFLSSLMRSLDEETVATERPVTTPGEDNSPVLVSVADAGHLTRAQGEALLRQAFTTVSKAR